MTETLHFVPQAEFARVRNLNTTATERTALFATLCRINTLASIVRAGSGHIGSSFSALDIIAWLFLNEMRGLGDASAPQDVFFSSKGHDAPGTYAAMAGIDLLPMERLRTLRRLGGLPGHPDVSTPHITTNTGSLGMGISKAKGLAWANRRAGKEARIFVMTGDGELQEGQIWESLVSAANSGLSEITAIVDHNKIQSDTWVAGTSDLGDLVAKFTAFGWRALRCDGHDMAALAAALKEAKSSDRPTVIIADTIKGRGVSFMEGPAMEVGGLYRFHSGAPSPADYAAGAAELIARANQGLSQANAAPLRIETESWTRPQPVAEPQRLVAAYGRALVAQAERNANVVALDADLVLDTGLIPFRDRFRDRFIECGIAEQDMVSQAGALALRGLVPFVHSFACFLSTRPNEQIYNNASERKKTVYVGSLAGLLPAGPGHSHQSVRDIALVASIPGMVVLEPSCEAEVEQAVDFCANRTSDSCYLRLVSIPCRVPYSLPSDYRLTLGRGVTLREGTDAVVFGYGPILLAEALAAAEIVARDGGLSVAVVNLPWLNRVDAAWLAERVRGARHVFTLDNHYTAGGQGAMLAVQMATAGSAIPVTLFGLDAFPECGRNDEALAAHQLDGKGVARRILARFAATGRSH